MMNRRNIVFEKVSRAQFISSMQPIIDEYNLPIDLNEVYDNIKLPERKTATSAGYDFFLPFDIESLEGHIAMIPTGIRCKMDEDLVLSIYPRSSYGFKYGMKVINTVGIIDSDYYYANNEGHIMVKVKFDEMDYGIKNTLRKKISLKAGEGFVQGIFTQFFISVDDDINEVRTGGIGSTDK